ncbi:RNA polymerase sigma-I factor [Acetivibrio cellulolyticus]|uniref:RNA polymerase sigma-I factor n=1 Tax=Acetivibrio cellulolyticus TaxID=35830 RepID=UPI0004751D88|nr:RNA polymerase sigma-I factor [Acetivibrio cellulolyticus]
MWILGVHTPEKRSFIDILHKIKNGDKLLKDRFISDYRPFIIKSVSKVLNNKFIDIENSEEYSIGLIAFNEAIEKYNEDRKCSFKKFSYQVIQRRLIDYRRKNQKSSVVYPFSYFEGDETYDFEEKFFKSEYSDHVYNFEIREEFSSFVKKMGDFGISMNDLVNTMPKHKDSRKTCVKIAKHIVEDENLYDKLTIKKTIPFKSLSKYIDVSQRTVERNRKYIIALVLILKSDLDIIKNYIKHLE